jgi:aminoglycoside phosphotransferase (APT) family kinase protein
MMMHTTIEDFPARLEAFLTEKLAGPVRITGSRQLAGGASRDTWSLDAETPQGRLPLVVRRDLGGQILEEALGRDGEFAVLSRAFDAGVHVPRPRWLCMDEGVIGSPFFVMDRLEGESVGRRVVREPTLAAARQALPGQMGEQLARIHALDYGGLSFLPRAKPRQSPALSALEKTAGQLHALGEPHPVLELAIRWLRPRAPACADPVLVHGDFRVGNLMVGPEGLVGVFDWEFAHVGDPHEDLAWPCVRSWRFGQDDLRLGGVGQPKAFFTAYESIAGRKVDRAALQFWEMMGNLRWAVGCIAQAHRHLSGQAPSVEFASLGRRTCEMELELLDLIEQAEGRR